MISFSSFVRSAAASILVLAWAASARAADDAGATAEVLFREGQKLMDAGDFAAACPKLAESQRLDPGNGTLARLATCHEKEGKNATAWSEFSELVTSAERAGQADRAKFARQHVASLQPQLSRLTIRVPPDVAAVDGLQVRRDELTVGPAVWGVALPVDPGDHVLAASAPGRVPWSTHVTVGATADAREVVVAPLAMAEVTVEAPVAKPIPEPPPPRATSSTQRTLGVVVAAAGVVGLGVGSYFGIAALSESNKAKDTCPNAACPSAAAVQQNDDARSNAKVADVVLPIGLAGAVAGSLLYFLAPGGPHIEPVVARTPGIRLVVRW
jgi:hypothetical protein